MNYVEQCKRGDDILSITKKIIMVIVALVLVCVIGVLIIASPWITIGVGLWLSPAPPKPEITYGEFPFRLEYEIDGEKIEVEDVLICKFDGFGFSEGSGGKFRKWSSKLKSGKTRITLLEVDGIEIYYPVGGATFYMGDPDNLLKSGTVFPDAYYTRDFDDQTVNGYIITADEMWDKYQLRLINWEIAPPIENNFK